ncbi:sugar ABC transporter substrate-binding protein [Chitiniphilus shinanonensis]|uniref:Sugar ABC transporter substrate-binding protein n=1 Tax=Chitiniphilus shinanonensis TaxID=553088 RepID=A0ABQ6BUH3_9NEIS|nr:extracellular solute-binding protein [Chitiniphilus shinanonensis]GLS04181.1 sugar ABC transporter substrate-binding protein [Chitiniphilus shinanonensis]
MKPALAALLTGALLASATAHAEKIRIEFWTMSLKPKFDDYFQKLEKDYERANPNVDIVWVDHPWDKILPRLHGAIAAAQPPALANLNVEWAYDLAQRRSIIPVDKLMGADRSVYMPGALADVTWDGRTWAYPWYNGVSVLAVNADLFRRAGLDPAKPIRTLDEQLAAAKQIAERTGVAGLAPELGLPMRIFMAEGLPLVQNNRAVFNSPAHVALLEKYVLAYKSKALIQDRAALFGEDNFQTAIAAYNAGKLAMLETAPTGLTRVRDDAKAIYAKTRVLPAPQGPTGVVKGGWLFDFVVPKGVDPKILPEVGKFAKYLTNDANQLAFSKATGGTYPSVTKAAFDPYFQQLPANAGAVEQARAIGARNLANVRTLTLLGVDDTEPLNRKLREEVESAVTGRKSAKAALDAAAAFWNDKLSNRR